MKKRPCKRGGKWIKPVERTVVEVRISGSDEVHRYNLGVLDTKELRITVGGSDGEQQPPANGQSTAELKP